MYIVFKVNFTTAYLEVYMKNVQDKTNYLSTFGVGFCSFYRRIGMVISISF